MPMSSPAASLDQELDRVDHSAIRTTTTKAPVRIVDFQGVRNRSCTAPKSRSFCHTAAALAARNRLRLPRSRCTFVAAAPDRARDRAGRSRLERPFERLGGESERCLDLVELVRIRASQINGCAFCIDMHTKDARAAGETEQRLYGLSAWREAPYYSERERAALAWAEAVTNISQTHASDEEYEAARDEALGPILDGLESAENRDP